MIILFSLKVLTVSNDKIIDRNDRAHTADNNNINDRFNFTFEVGKREIDRDNAVRFRGHEYNIPRDIILRTTVT